MATAPGCSCGLFGAIGAGSLGVICGATAVVAAALPTVDGAAVGVGVGLGSGVGLGVGGTAGDGVGAGVGVGVTAGFDVAVAVGVAVGVAAVVGAGFGVAVRSGVGLALGVGEGDAVAVAVAVPAALGVGVAVGAAVAVPVAAGVVGVGAGVVVAVAVPAGAVAVPGGAVAEAAGVGAGAGTTLGGLEGVALGLGWFVVVVVPVAATVVVEVGVAVGIAVAGSVDVGVAVEVGVGQVSTPPGRATAGWASEPGAQGSATGVATTDAAVSSGSPAAKAPCADGQATVTRVRPMSRRRLVVRQGRREITRSNLCLLASRLRAHDRVQPSRRERFWTPMGKRFTAPTVSAAMNSSVRRWGDPNKSCREQTSRASSTSSVLPASYLGDYDPASSAQRPMRRYLP